MTVYIDKMNAKYRGMIMCHMMSANLDELHKMADAMGLKREWFQDKPGSTPHYDVSLTKKRLALKLGAVVCDNNKIVEIIKHHRAVEKAVTERDAVRFLKLVKQGREI